MRDAARWVAVLLVVGAVLFGVGSFVERSTHAAESGSAAEPTHQEGAEGEPGHQEGEEGEGGDEGGEGTEAVVAIGNVFGIDAESPLAVGGLIVASLALAAAVWLRPTRLLFAVIAVFSLGLVIFDALEVQFQLGEAIAVAVIAAMVALIHLTAGLIAARQAIRQESAGLKEGQRRQDVIGGPTRERAVAGVDAVCGRGFGGDRRRLADVAVAAGVAAVAVRVLGAPS